MSNLKEDVKAIALIKKRLHKLIRDMASNDYHGLRYTYSSTQFKDLLDDEDIFIKKHIKKEMEREESPAFDVGTYFHTAVLEPQKLKLECTVFPGKIRRGEAWETFKANNAGKTIVTQQQQDQALGLVKAVKASPVAQGYLVGEPEVTLMVEIAIYQGEIHAPHFGKLLSKDGWITSRLTEKQYEKAHIIFVKVRADMLGETFVSDLKSTTGNAKSNKIMREKISYYNYDLSASLYLDMFSLVRPDVQEFIWIFASKDVLNSKSYRASETNIKVGRAKYMHAMVKMADCAKNNWQSVDYLDELEPLPYELEWLKEKDRDLL